MTCKDCLHFNVCGASEKINIGFFPCNLFQNKSLFMELPCRVGDTVYNCIFYKDGTGHYIRLKVVGFHLGDFPRMRGKDREEYLIIYHEVTNSITHINVAQIGKTVFFTEEEAKKALKEMEQK